MRSSENWRRETLVVSLGLVYLRSMPRLELRCPTCSLVLARLRRVRTSVGRPFEECQKCRTFVARPATNEWPLMGPFRKVLWLVDRVLPFVVLGLTPGTAYWVLLSSRGNGDRQVLLALAIGVPVVLALSAFWVARHTIRRSRARMADPMYRARLVEFGRAEFGRQVQSVP